MKKLFLLFILCFSLFGCASLEERKNELLNQAVYATNDSIQAERFELAKEWSAKAKNLVYPPKNKIEIKAIKKNNQSLIILPKGSDINNVMVVDSKEYQIILEQNKDLRSIVEKNNKDLNMANKKIEDLERDLAKELEKQKENTFLNRIKKWFTGFGILGIFGGLGLGALFFFNPALFGVVIKALGSVLEIFMRIINAIIDWIKYIIVKISELKK